MKRWAVLVLLLAVFAVSVLLTAVEGFRNLDGYDAALLDWVAIPHGHVAPVFVSPYLWSRYPAIPNHLSVLVCPTAFLITVPLLLVALHFARIGGRRPFPLQVAVCLAAALAPYAVGATTLHNRPIDDPRAVGSWLAVMLLGPLYVLIICAIICIVELLRPDPRPRAIHDRLPIECSPVITAAQHQ
jgi:hypothetical protein